ncbi:MAG: hypothetical protein WBV39_16505 [Rudaea sp.]
MQGGIEAIILVAALSATQLLRKASLRLLLTLLISESYLRRQGVDVPVAVDFVYFETLVALGAFVTVICRVSRPNAIPDYLRCFLIGLSFWSVVVWTASLLGFGGASDLRWLTLLLLPVAAAARARPWCIFLLDRVSAMTPGVRAATASLLGWVLVLFARSEIALDFDARWYGLRGEYVLAGAGSAFKSMGLTSPVHYFPKLYEMMLLPLSGLGEASVVSSFTVAVLVMLVAATWHILKQLRVDNDLAKVAAAGACLTLPALANIAIGPKPDVLAAFCLIFAWIEGSAYLQARAWTHLLWVATAVVLAIQAKLTAIPFAAALVAAIVAASFVRRAQDTSPTEQPRQAQVTLAAAALVLGLSVASLVTLRTLLLAGVPTIGPDPLLSLWQSLGFQLTPPAGTIQWGFPVQWHDIPALAADLLFRPQRLDHIVITWTGNVWAWLATIAIAVHLTRHNFREPQQSHVMIPGAALAATGFLLMFCWSYRDRGGDGNYFIAGLVPTILIGTALTKSLWQKEPLLRTAFCLSLTAFCLFDGAYCFASAAWTPGTRTFDVDFSRGFHAFRKRNAALLEANGMSVIGRRLATEHTVARVVGYVQDEVGFALPASFEGLWMISFTHPEYVTSTGNLLRFLKANNIRFVIMPHSDVSRNETHITNRALAIEKRLATDPGVTAIVDKEYTMYDLSELERHGDGRH